MEDVIITAYSVTKIFLDYSFKNELKKYGLGENEITIYLTLLNKNKLTIAKISSFSNTPRSTVVENLGKLLDKGLVTETVVNSQKVFFAEPPAKLKDLILEKQARLKDEEESLNQLNKNLPFLLNNLSLSKVRESSGDITIRFYRGKTNVWKLYKETLSAKEVWSFCNLDKFYEVFPDTRSIFKKAFENIEDRKVYDILIDTPIAREVSKEAEDGYFTKFLPNNSYFTGFVFGDYMIFENKVMLVQLEAKKPIAIVIESVDISLGFKGLHKTMWEVL